MPDRQRRSAPVARAELTKSIGSSKAPAISRAAAVLRLLGKSDVPLGVHAIARELGLVPSTCLYVLRALVAEEFVAFDHDTKRYALEAGVLTLARHWLRQNQFNDLVQPVLNRIGQEFDATILGVQIVGLDHIIVVAISQSGQNIQLSTQVGSRFPALISATGRCIAAFGGHARNELEARFRALRWDQPPTLAEWTAQVAQTRVQGFAVDSGHYISGVTLIAAPVWKVRSKLTHAVVAIGLSGAISRTGLPALQDALVSACQTLSTQLCGET